MNRHNRVNAQTVFTHTLKFSFIKLALGAGMLLVSGILLAVFLGIGMLIGEDVIVVMFIGWFAISGFINFFLTRYVGYLVKAGHIAVITEAVTTGRIPEDQLNYAINRVKKRFATANIYFIIDSFISGAVKQLQHIIERAGNLFGMVPGMGAVAAIVKLFIDISLGYIDECCLGYTFYNEEQNVYKSAADGVVIYYQNWKKLLKNAAVTTLTVIISFIITAVILFFLFLALFEVFAPDMKVILALIFAGFLSYVVKYAFIDSWILVKIIAAYMELAPQTEITYDLYGKLSGYSKKFKNLFIKGQQTGGVTSNYFAGAEAGNAYSSQQRTTQQPRYPGQNTAQRPPATTRQQQKPVFCSDCGSKNKVGTEFCENCGFKIG